jgi:DNA (cytosine-5)-methyltransferase 1
MSRIHTKLAAKKIGVSEPTLKRWLISGKVKDVNRDRNGWRVFTESDIARIKYYAEESEPSLVSRPYTVSSFFAGIGGFDLGFEQAGFKVNFQCEIETFCKNILEKHWPNISQWGDITTLDNANIPVSDAWVGGFPCQDLSLARMGKREGLRGRKSRLFHEFARLVAHGQPRVLVIENVAGLLSSHQGRDFRVLLHSLAELGYAIGWRTFNSRYFGVPQSRQRVYIVGCLRDWRGPGKILFESERSTGYSEKSRQNEKKAPSPFQKIIGNASEDGPMIQSIAYCLYATSARHTGTDWSRNYACYPESGRVRRLTPNECEKVMAFPAGWTVPDNVELNENDLDSVRYHALGNAVTPPVAYWLAKRVKKYLDERESELRGITKNDQQLVDLVD